MIEVNKFFSKNWKKFLVLKIKVVGGEQKVQ